MKKLIRKLVRLFITDESTKFTNNNAESNKTLEEEDAIDKLIHQLYLSIENDEEDAHMYIG